MTTPRIFTVPTALCVDYTTAVCGDDLSLMLRRLGVSKWVAEDRPVGVPLAWGGFLPLDPPHTAVVLNRDDGTGPHAFTPKQGGGAHQLTGGLPQDARAVFAGVLPGRTGVLISPAAPLSLEPREWVEVSLIRDTLESGVSPWAMRIDVWSGAVLHSHPARAGVDMGEGTSGRDPGRALDGEQVSPAVLYAATANRLGYGRTLGDVWQLVTARGDYSRRGLFHAYCAWQSFQRPARGDGSRDRRRAGLAMFSPKWEGERRRFARGVASMELP